MTFLIAAFGLRSRRLASLAAISLLASATAGVTISRIPSAPARRLISGRLPAAVAAAVVPLLLLASVPGLVQKSGRPAAGQNDRAMDSGIHLGNRV